MAKQTQSLAQDFLGPKRVKQLVRFYVEMQRPVYIHGQPGIGKSDIIKSIGKELGRDVYDVRLLLMTETDIRGIPYFNSTSGKMEWAPPATFPLDENSNAILFLDEISQASPSVQAAALQLVLDRKIGDFVLPSGVSIVAAGNTQSDRTGAKPLITALRNRFAHVFMKSSFKDWQEWAIEAQVHPDVIGFLSANEQYLNKFDTVTTENSFCTPRSWVLFVSDPLKSGKLAPEMLNDVVTAGVGQAAATLFVNLSKIISKLPSVDDILSGKVKTMDGIPEDSKMAACFSITTNLAYRLTEVLQAARASKKEEDMEAWFSQANMFYDFVQKNMDPEIGMMALSQCVKLYDFPMNRKKIPALDEWMTKNRKYFVSSQTMSVD